MGHLLLSFGVACEIDLLSRCESACEIKRTRETGRESNVLLVGYDVKWEWSMPAV
jgi:hypothetical protein